MNTSNCFLIKIVITLPKIPQYKLIEGFFSQTIIIKCGVPQGSTLGPLLLLIYINDLTDALEKSIAHHFADDTNSFIIWQ